MTLVASQHREGRLVVGLPVRSGTLVATDKPVTPTLVLTSCKCTYLGISRLVSIPGQSGVTLMVW